MTFTAGPEPTQTDWALLAVPAAVAVAAGSYALFEHERGKKRASARPSLAPVAAAPGLRIHEWRRARLKNREAAVTLRNRLDAACTILEEELQALVEDARAEGTPITFASQAPPPPDAAAPCAPVASPDGSAFLPLRVSRLWHELTPPGSRLAGAPRLDPWRAHFTDEESARRFVAALPASCQIAPEPLREITQPARDARRLTALAPLLPGVLTDGVACEPAPRDGGFDVLFARSESNPPPAAR